MAAQRSSSSRWVIRSSQRPARMRSRSVKSMTGQTMPSTPRHPRRDARSRGAAEGEAQRRLCTLKEQGFVAFAHLTELVG
jgi:hypothetical protein